MKAPSERHLEDWFTSNVSNLEYTIDGEIQEFALEVVTRQLRLPSGIADVILQGPNDVVVAELKKGVIDTATLAQCLRYMRDVKRIMGYALAYIRDPRIEHWTLADPEVTGILIGRAIESENLLIAASCANVSVYLYDYTAEINTYAFQAIEPAIVDWHTYLEYAQDGIGEAFRQAYIGNAEAILRHPEGIAMLMNIRRTLEAFQITQQSVHPHPIYDEEGRGEGFPTLGGEE